MKIILKGLAYMGSGIGLILVILLCILFSVRWLKTKKIGITTPNGIQEKGYIQLGGILQYIQIRGEDRRNSVIVFLHGGPGNTISHLAYSYQTNLESQYTFVNWDQRGAGRTYYKNENLDIRSGLSTDILLKDLDELVDYIREELGQDQIIVIGHSWGTLLGSQYVLRHPEKVLAYVGIGQVVSGKEGYIYSANEALKKANEQGDTKVASQLESAINLFEKTNGLEAFDFNNFIKMQQDTMRYHTYKGQLSTFKMIEMILTSPELSFEEVKWFFKTNNPDQLIALQGPLINDCFFNLQLDAFGNQYEVPVHYITGEYDVSTPSALIQTYYEQLEVPTKSLTIIPNTGHLPFFDAPEVFSETLHKILTTVASD